MWSSRTSLAAGTGFTASDFLTQMQIHMLESQTAYVIGALRTLEIQSRELDVPDVDQASPRRERRVHGVSAPTVPLL